MTGPEIPGYVRPKLWKPLLGIPAGLAIGLGLGNLPGTWGLWGVLLLCLVGFGGCIYMLVDLRRDQRRMQVLMRRWEYMEQQRRGED